MPDCESLGTSHRPDVADTVDWALKQFPFHSPGTKGRANHASKKATQRDFPSNCLYVPRFCVTSL